MRDSLFAVLLTGFAACTLGACVTQANLETHPHQSQLRPLAPLPTGGETQISERQEGDEDLERQLERQRWIEEIHVTAPGVDWRAIEERNHQRELERRNLLGVTAGPAAGGKVWQEVGSRNQAGRMVCTTLSPDGQTLYAGADRGGAWRAGLNGENWEPLADHINGGVHHIVALPGTNAGDQDVLVIASGSTVYKSTNMGLTWIPATGLTGVSEIRSMDTIEVDVFGDVFPVVFLCGQVNGRTTVFASGDYGSHFEQRYQASNSNFRGTFWIPEKGTGANNDIYLITRSGVRLSVDQGFNFNFVGSVSSGASEGVITGSEAGAPDLYVALNLGSWRIFNSSDAGQSFQERHTANTWWSRSLAASMLDSDQVMYGGLEVWESTNGGNNFSRINGWGEYYGNPAHKLHADIPGIQVHEDPADAAKEIWYVCTDGGIFQSRDNGENWDNITLVGLGVSQYYSIHSAVDQPDVILAGAQDQGYQRGTLSTPTGPGPSTNFDQLISGDYAHLTSGDGTHELVYSVYPGFILIQDGANNPIIRSDDFPPGAPAPWLPFIVADPLDSESFFFGSDQLYYYTRVSNGNWNESVHTAQSFTVGGGAYITAMSFAPTNPLRMYAVNSSGQLFVSSDHGITWSNTSSGAPNDHYLYGQAIAVHPTDQDEVVVGGSGYSTTGVIRSVDGGQTWQPLGAATIPQTQFYSVTYGPQGAGASSGDVYAATESGAWRWDRATDTWENIMFNEAPNTLYWDVEAVEPATVRFASYSRGIWDYQVPVQGGYYTFGEGKLNSVGLTTFLTGTGTPTFSSDDFDLNVFLGLPFRPGIVLWAFGQTATPFKNATLYLAPPIKRDIPFQFDSTGTAVIPIDVDLELAGLERFYQVWYRDTPPRRWHEHWAL